MHTDRGSMTTPITSTELNYLVFRYLAESGFTHSGFSFGFEAGINKSTIDENLVPPGGLVTLVQKGIQYLELEANMLNDDLDTDEDFQFMNPLELLSKDMPELQKIIKQRKENGQKDSEGKDKVKPSENVMDANHVGDTSNGKLEENANNGGSEPMDVSMSLPSWPREVPDSDVTVLEGHTSEVFACAWSPTDSLLASGSGDSTARIWTVDGPSSSNMNYGPSSIVLRHLKERPSEKTEDVTTLDWNVDGTVLATGCYDGQARLWAKHGELLNTLRRHRGPIFSLKWNKKGDYLLSGSMDKTAIVWDVKTATWKQVFEFHSAPLLDVDWRNNVSFATCSADSMIYVCKVGENRPIKTFRGHQGEINAIKWDPSGSVLASCSDDRTVKIWSMKQDTYLLELKEHSKEIYSVGWSPTGPGTNNPNRKLLLASASFDSTIKLWDVEVGRLLNNLAGHRHEVYSVAFSPDGKYLASGSLDKSLLIWSVQEAKIIKRFSGHAGVFEVCWNKEGNKIAACFADSKVCVMDFLM